MPNFGETMAIYFDITGAGILQVTSSTFVSSAIIVKYTSPNFVTNARALLLFRIAIWGCFFGRGRNLQFISHSHLLRSLSLSPFRQSISIMYDSYPGVYLFDFHDWAYCILPQEFRHHQKLLGIRSEEVALTVDISAHKTAIKIMFATIFGISTCLSLNVNVISGHSRLRNRFLCFGRSESEKKKQNRTNV